jgi:hypothetical protein
MRVVWNETSAECESAKERWTTWFKKWLCTERKSRDNTDNDNGKTVVMIHILMYVKRVHQFVAGLNVGGLYKKKYTNLRNGSTEACVVYKNVRI